MCPLRHGIPLSQEWFEALTRLLILLPDESTARENFLVICWQIRVPWWYGQLADRAVMPYAVYLIVEVRLARNVGLEQVPTVGCVHHESKASSRRAGHLGKGTEASTIQAPHFRLPSCVLRRSTRI